MAELLKIYPENPNSKEVRKVAKVLQNGGVIIYPTDTVYAFGCDIKQPKALERVARLKGIKPNKANFSLVFYDLSQLADYTRQVDTPTYKILKRCLPGAFTFILHASNAIPKLFQSNKKTVGIRIPNNNIPRAIVQELGNPIIATSVHDDDEIIDYTTDPESIFENYKNQVDLVIDGGTGDNSASTVVDLTEGIPTIIREGKGDLNLI